MAQNLGKCLPKIAQTAKPIKNRN